VAAPTPRIPTGITGFNLIVGLRRADVTEVVEIGTSFELPRLGRLARHAVPHILEATILPLVLFYLAMWLLGTWGAFIAALLWTYGALARRVLGGKQIPGVLALGAVLLTLRTVLAFLSGSVFVYFLQPTLGTVGVGGAFLASVPAGNPLAQRLAADFCPLPESLLARPFVRDFFVRISVLWAVVHIVSAAISLWLLLSQPLAVYVVAKSIVSMVVMGGAIGISVAMFMRSMHHNGVAVVRS
jgi:hypothetical protein